MSTFNSLPGIPELKDNGDAGPSDSGSDNPGEALSKFDFSHVHPLPHADLVSQGPDQSDAHAALASMSSEDALDYAISHIGLSDHLDTGHLDVGHSDLPTDTSHDA